MKNKGVISVLCLLLICAIAGMSVGVVASFLISAIKTNSLTEDAHSDNAPKPIQLVIGDNPVFMGNLSAPYTIVEFGDFQCPACIDAFQHIKFILSQYPTQCRFIFRHFPLTKIHVNALSAARVVEGAKLQGKSSQATEELFNCKGVLDYEHIASVIKRLKIDEQRLSIDIKNDAKQGVDSDVADGEKLQVRSTPTIFLCSENAECHRIASLTEVEGRLK